MDQELGTFRLPKNSERSESTSAVPTSPAPKKDASSPSSTSKSGTDTLTWDDIDEGSSQTSSKESRNGVFVKISNDFNVFKLLATESVSERFFLQLASQVVLKLFQKKFVAVLPNFF